MGQPLWKKVYDVAEQQAAPVLTRALSTPEVIEAVGLALAVRRRAVDDVSQFFRRNLHNVNLPSGTDVRDVSNQIAGLERQIRQLNRRIDELTPRSAGSTDDACR